MEKPGNQWMQLKENVHDFLSIYTCLKLIFVIHVATHIDQWSCMFIGSFEHNEHAFRKQMFLVYVKR